MVPRYTPATNAAAIPPAAVGKGSTDGLVNLLRRNIPVADILRVCLNEWKQTRSGARLPDEDRQREMQRIIDADKALPMRKRNPAKAYNSMATAAHRQKHMNNKE